MATISLTAGYVTEALEATCVTGKSHDAGRRSGEFTSVIIGCELDVQYHESRLQRVAAPLASRAFEIIEVVAGTRSELVTQDTLMERLWSGQISNDNALQIQISAIRKALGCSSGLVARVQSNPLAPVSPANADGAPLIGANSAISRLSRWRSNSPPRAAALRID